MVKRITAPAALATLLAVSLTALPTAAPGAQGNQDRSSAAGSRSAELGVPLLFSVKGLTVGNLEQVRGSLKSLTESVYQCSGCKHETAKPGKCALCGIDLLARKESVLSEVLPSVESANVELTPFAARNLSYAEIEGALRKSSIEIEGAKFPLAGSPRLVVRGGSSEDVQAIEKALEGTGLFASAEAKYDSASTEIHVGVHSAATPPMHQRIVDVIEALESKAILADVIWGPRSVPSKI